MEIALENYKNILWKLKRRPKVMYLQHISIDKP